MKNLWKRVRGTHGALGMADIFTAFYFHILNHNPKNPLWEERDRLILQTATLRLFGMRRWRTPAIPARLKTLRKFGSRLQGTLNRTTAFDQTSGLWFWSGAGSGYRTRRQNGWQEIPRVLPYVRRRTRSGNTWGRRCSRRTTSS